MPLTCDMYRAIPIYGLIILMCDPLWILASTTLWLNYCLEVGINVHILDISCQHLITEDIVILRERRTNHLTHHLWENL